MRRLILILVILLVPSMVFGATLSLKASWTQNTETDMKEYRLYRTDGTRALLGTVQHPAAQLLFSISVPDNSKGTAIFALTAVDTAGNESGDANANYPFDVEKPGAPVGFGVSKQ